MKTPRLHPAVRAFLAALFLLVAPMAGAQVVTTGVVVGASPATGIVTVLSDQTRRNMNFNGMERARIERASGRAASLADVWTGMRVTISYVQRGGRWYVSRFAIPDPPPPVASVDERLWLMTPGSRNSRYSRAATDDDITTRPGNRAFTDGDITIKPPRRALFERDITLRNDNR